MASNTLQPGVAPATALARRHLLGAICAAPLAALPFTALAKPIGDTAWRDALAAYWRASDATDRYYRDHLEPATDRDNATRARLGITSGVAMAPDLRAAYEPHYRAILAFEDRHGEFVASMMRAADAVVFMPAPDAAALAEKLHIYMIETDGCDVDKAWNAALLADVRRLAPRKGQ